MKFVRDAEEERVTIINMGDDKALNKDGRGVGTEGGAEIYLC